MNAPLGNKHVISSQIGKLYHHHGQFLLRNSLMRNFYSSPAKADEIPRLFVSSWQIIVLRNASRNTTGLVLVDDLHNDKYDTFRHCLGKHILRWNRITHKILCLRNRP